MKRSSATVTPVKIPDDSSSDLSNLSASNSISNTVDTSSNNNNDSMKEMQGMLTTILATQAEFSRHLSMIEGKVDTSLKEIAVMRASPPGSVNRMQSNILTVNGSSASTIAGEMYGVRSNNHKSNILHIRTIMEKHKTFFAPIIKIFPNIDLMLSHVLVNLFGFAAGRVDHKKKLADLTEADCRRFGSSISFFLRKRKTADVALDAHQKHFVQMSVLYDEVEGFAEFMNVIASNLLRDSMYGMVYRVSIGAVSSTSDAATEIYVIFTYYETDALVSRAHTLLAMICLNVFFQILVGWVQCKKKSIVAKLRELLIALFFLRPAVDAYRVSTHQEDEEAPMDPLREILRIKVLNLLVKAYPAACSRCTYIYPFRKRPARSHWSRL